MAKTDTKPVGGKPDKLVRDALMAAIRQEPERLKRIANKWLTLAEEGDMQAINALADRVDGKVLVAASVDVTSNGETLSAGESRLIDLIAQIKSRAEESAAVH